MTKNKQTTADEALVDIFKTSLDYIQKSDELELKIIDNEIKFLQQQIAFKEEREPLKIFKKAHNKWEKELDALEEKLANTYKKLNDEVVSQMEFHRKMSEH